MSRRLRDLALPAGCLGVVLVLTAVAAVTQPPRVAVRFAWFDEAAPAGSAIAFLPRWVDLLLWPALAAAALGATAWLAPRVRTSRTAEGPLGLLARGCRPPGADVPGLRLRPAGHGDRLPAAARHLWVQVTLGPQGLRARTGPRGVRFAVDWDDVVRLDVVEVDAQDGRPVRTRFGRRAVLRSGPALRVIQRRQSPLIVTVDGAEVGAAVAANHLGADRVPALVAPASTA